MRITEITHERIRQLRPFETARVSLTASLDEDDDPVEVLAELKSKAEAFLYPKKEEKKTEVTEDQIIDYINSVEHDDLEIARQGGGPAFEDDDIPY